MEKKFKMMNWEDSDIEKLFEYFDELQALEQLQFIKWLCQHHPKLDLDWFDLLYDVIEVLSYNEKITAYEEFVFWFPEFQPKEYAERCEFIERDLCDYYIHTNNLQKLKERIQVIIKNPIAGIETITIRLYYQLIYHGLFTEASDYAKVIHKPIHECEQIWGNPETPLIQGIYLDALQEVYQEYKTSGIFNKNTLIKIAKEIDLEENVDILEIEKHALQNQFNSEAFNKKINGNKANVENTLIGLNIYFLKYMFETYQIPFKFSEYLWNIVSVKKLFNQSKSNGFFYIDVKAFDKILEKRIDYSFGSNLFEMFGKIWGLNYVYEFLENTDLISKEDARLMEENNTYHFHEIIKYANDELWQMNFIFKWPNSHRWIEYEPLFNSTYGTDFNTAQQIINLFLKNKPVPQRILKQKGQITQK